MMITINLYMLTVDFNIPKKDAPHNALKLKAGHRLVVIDKEVYVKLEKLQDELSDDNYIEVLLTRAFIKMNPKIFKKI